MEGTKKDIISIPLYFKSYKDLYIGKGSIKTGKSNFKFTTPKTISSIKYNIKEFQLINKDKSKSNIVYNGREAPQDSCYVLMKYSPENHCIQMCTANKWVNFTQSFNYKEQKFDDIEKRKKEEKKEQNKNMKYLFNFDYYDEMHQEKPKKKTRKKKTLMPTENEDDIDNDNDNDDEVKPKKKKKNKFDFDEDSHSSENSLELKEDSYESENERIKEEERRLREEEEEKKRKEEEKKKEKEKENFSDDEDDDEDKSFENAPSDVDENEVNNNEFFDLLSKKRKRDKYPDELLDELKNLLRKKNKRTYEEIINELIKKFKGEIIENYIDKLLDENTNKFIEGGETYYFLK